MKRMATVLGVIAASAAAPTLADVFETYESLTEGALGGAFSLNGVHYHSANAVNGVNVDGDPFGPTDLGNTLIIENATLFYNDFPAYGSPINSLTFGSAWVPGDNLSIGVLASVLMDLDEPGAAASLDLAFYENGPWGGIQYYLDAVDNGVVVATDTFTISDLGGRDNATFRTLTVSAPHFDQLHLYAELNGTYTNPRGMIDNLSVTAVPEPASTGLMGLAAALLIRRRR